MYNVEWFERSRSQRLATEIHW